MNTVAIDIGNSFTKIDFWCDNGFTGREVFKDLDCNTFMDLIKNYDIEGIIICTVRKDSDQFVKDIKELADCEVVVFDNEEIRKFYEIRYSGNVGPDRIAAALGANRCYPKKAKLVVDAGTAMTLDIVDENGIFCGGNISLGLYSRMKALAEATSKLPDVETIEGGGFFGSDTLSAIQAGAVNGVVGEILYTIQCAKAQFGANICLLTGGDTDMVVRSFYDDSKVVTDPYLVGSGLDYHLRTHYLHAQGGKNTNVI